MRKTTPKYGWHSATVGCDTKNCLKPKMELKSTTNEKSKMKKCLVCPNEFLRKTRNGKENKYCSKECSAKAHKGIASLPNARLRKGIARFCPKCGENEIFNKEKTCLSCRFEAKFGRGAEDYSLITLKELKERYNLQQYHAKIRGHARSIFKKNKGALVCKECGYSMHVDICHIKDIKDFSMATNIKQINDFSNLEALCKNCHWEFDNPNGLKMVDRLSQISDRTNLTLGSLKTAIPKRWASRLRSGSRATYFKSGKPRACNHCFYNKRIDICHIKDVKDFDENTTIAEINNLYNLVALCPKHHWEFDHTIPFS